jgi:mono/diheme cytochrome c family protein
MKRTGFRWGWLALMLPLLALLVTASLMFSAQGGFEPLRVPEDGTRAVATDQAVIDHGAYLARIGNCVTCHSTRGGTPYAGGRTFESEYGTIHSSNLTPDRTTGLGDWTNEEFRHAMRHGVSRTGLLYPVFPFAHFEHLTDSDLDALFAYLAQLPPASNATPANALSFPAGWRNASVLGWRMLFHRPRPLTDDSDQPPQWHRGRYLVDGLGHCGMCHSGRGAMQSLPAERHMAGGHITGQGWYAPPLDRISLSRWQAEELADYLRSGVSPHGSAYGSMAEVIYTSLQHLTADDALAMATYLKTIEPAVARRMSARRNDRISQAPASANGLRLYQTHCASCHGDDGRGRGNDYPPLAGNPLVASASAVNSVRMVLFGGVAPVTADNPRPYSMPPYTGRLDEDEVAAVVSYIRAAWGNSAPPVGIDEVRALRRIPLD